MLSTRLLLDAGSGCLVSLRADPDDPSHLALALARRHHDPLLGPVSTTLEVDLTLDHAVTLAESVIALLDSADAVLGVPRWLHDPALALVEPERGPEGAPGELGS